MISIKILLNLSKISIGSPRYLFLIRAVSLFADYVGANFWDTALRKSLVARFFSVSVILYFRAFP
jgi:hypothetical protein